MYTDIFLILLAIILTSLVIHIYLLRLSFFKSVYLSALVIFNFVSLISIIFYSQLVVSLKIEYLLVILLFVNSFFVVYTLLLIGVVNDSPTLAIVKAIIAKEPDPFTQEDLDAFIKCHPFVSARMHNLSTSTGIKYQNNIFVISSKVKSLVTLIRIYQKFVDHTKERG